MILFESIFLSLSKIPEKALFVAGFPGKSGFFVLPTNRDL